MLVGTALPWAVRIGKEDPDREPRCQALVLSHLVASIIGQRFAQRGGHVLHLELEFKVCLDRRMK